MPGWLLRLLIALVVLVALNMILPSMARLAGIPLSPDVFIVIRVLAFLFAMFYVVRGPGRADV